MKFMTVLLFVFISLFSSCSKGNNTVNNIVPTNLNVTANIATDNSGNVTFTATATNAISYDFDFGNGIFQTVTSGIITYKYPSSGNYSVNVIAKSASGQTISKSIQISVTVSNSLLWSDEFNTAGSPDPSKWGYDLGNGCPSLCGWGNNELQFYTNRSDNVIVSNGTLKVIAKRENYNGSAFTSARLITQNKFSFKYGKIEIRAKLPAGVGTWPAIWMLGSNIPTVGWPACGEIDIMEHRGSHLNTISGALHHPGHSGGNPDAGTVNISNTTTEFHKYAVEWSASTIKFLVDDAVYFTFANNASLPFNQNFFIILNVAMGGNYGGPVESGFTSAAMEIDYVRVYQ
jgi:beta-glucanase (GH16 family)